MSSSVALSAAGSFDDILKNFGSSASVQKHKNRRKVGSRPCLVQIRLGPEHNICQFEHIKDMESTLETLECDVERLSSAVLVASVRVKPPIGLDPSFLLFCSGCTSFRTCERLHCMCVCQRTVQHPHGSVLQPTSRWEHRRTSKSFSGIALQAHRSRSREDGRVAHDLLYQSFTSSSSEISNS